jgi:hypothetical protein
MDDVIDQEMTVSDTEPFQWDSTKEDSLINRTNYVKYLQDNVLCNGFEYPMNVFDPTQESDLLDAEFSEDFTVTGTCDALISSTTMAGCMIQSSHIVFELKKPENKENKIKQAKLELLSAGRRSTYDVIVVLTDLNDSWIILWLETTRKTFKGKIATLCCTELTRNLAIGFLRYHLKIVAKLRRRNQSEVALDVKYDDEYKDEDNGMEHPNKKQNCCSRKHGPISIKKYE